MMLYNAMISFSKSRKEILMSDIPPAVSRAYLRRFVIAGVAYTALVSITAVILRQDFPESMVVRALISVLPVLPVMYGMVAYLRFLRGIDELQRRIHLEGVGFSLAMTSIITLTLGFLERVGIETLSMIWVMPLIIVLWSIGLAVANRRYS
jgi:hypothetical protein